MSLLVTGSIGIDTVRTPFGVSENCIGGSAVHFSTSASFFSPVRFVGVIGDDCPFDLEKLFEERAVDLTGLEVRDGSKTFRWQGSYEGEMNEANTDGCELNVLAEEPPAVPKEFADSEYVFLANTTPALQMQLLEQVKKPKLVAADTMNIWITTALDDLKELLTKIDLLTINEGEARLLTGERNINTAANKILEMGPEVVIVKKGEYGSMMCNKDGDIFVLPAYPADVVVDPTGAGDSFAGALMGYIAGVDKSDAETMRRAMVYGTVAASINIGDFSVDGLMAASKSDIEERYHTLQRATQF